MKEKTRKMMIFTIILLILVSVVGTSFVLVYYYDLFNLNSYVIVQFNIEGTYAKNNKPYSPTDAHRVYDVLFETTNTGFKLDINMKKNFSLYSSHFMFLVNTTVNYCNLSIFTNNISVKFVETNKPIISIDFTYSFTNLHIIFYADIVVKSETVSSLGGTRA